MADYVPNMLRCAKCNFELERFTLNANTGAVGIGTNEPERCPNGCGPLWRVTWEQEAQYLGKRMNEWADRAIAAEKKLAALGVKEVPPTVKAWEHSCPGYPARVLLPRGSKCTHCGATEGSSAAAPFGMEPDDHGVVLTQEQARELLRDALGVEVELPIAGVGAFDPDQPHCPGCGDASGWNGSVRCALCNSDGSKSTPAGAQPWDASQIKQPGWHHVEAAFIEGAREARANPEADEAMFRRAADGYTKRVFEEVDPTSEAALRTESWQTPGVRGADDQSKKGSR